MKFNVEKNRAMALEALLHRTGGVIHNGNIYYTPHNNFHPLKTRGNYLHNQAKKGMSRYNMLLRHVEMNNNRPKNKKMSPSELMLQQVRARLRPVGRRH